MRKVLKYALENIVGAQVINLPHHGVVRHVGLQEDVIHLWIEVDDQSPPETRSFVIYGTGWPIERKLIEHLGTVQTETGFVWHIYEEANAN